MFWLKLVPFLAAAGIALNRGQYKIGIRISSHSHKEGLQFVKMLLFTHILREGHPTNHNPYMGPLSNVMLAAARKGIIFHGIIP